MLFGEKEVEFDLPLLTEKVRCETNLAVLQQQVSGRLCLTNYRVVFKPHISNKTTQTELTESTLKIINKPYILEYFNVPLGLIFSVEARTPVKGNNKAGDSFVEVVTKDGRQIKFIVPDPYFGETVAAKIKVQAFLD